MSRGAQAIGARRGGPIWGRNVQTRGAGKPPPEWYWDSNHWSYTGGEHGDGRERAASEFAQEQAPKGKPDALLKAIDMFHSGGRDHELIHIGPRKGAWLAAAAKSRKPSSVLEFGTQIGYSTILIAQQLPAGGHLWTIEPNPSNVALAEANIAHANLRKVVTVLAGTFEDVWEEMPCPVDFVFLDHSRSKYLRDLRILEKWGYVSDGTVVVADNIGGEAGSHGHAKAEEYADHVRSGRYCSSFFWGDDDGIEVSEFVSRGSHAKVVTDEWKRGLLSSSQEISCDEILASPSALSQEQHASPPAPSPESPAQEESSPLPGRAGAAGAGRRWGRGAKAQRVARSIALSNGLELALLGFGTWNLRGAACEVSLRAALQQGYGLIDTSSAYGNEADIGRVLSEANESRGILLQTKVGPRDMGYTNARNAAERSKKHLGRVDILLIHWPGRDRMQLQETWRALEELYEEKEVGAIGVSNFLPEHIKGLLEGGARIKPMVNQVEIHLLCQGRDVVEYCRKEGIAVQSYSTLGGGPKQGKIRLEDGTARLLGHPVVQAVAAEVCQSPAAVCLRWAIQQGMAVIPKSSSPEHIAKNAVALEFELSEEHMARLARLDEDHHFAWNPRDTLTSHAGFAPARRPQAGAQ